MENEEKIVIAESKKHKSVYEHVTNFKRKYPGGIFWHRLKKHAQVIEDHINPGEYVLYAFAAQKNEKVYEIFQTCVVALTNQRLLIGQKRVVFGYFYNSITPDLFNDLSIYSGIFWGKVTIDTVKEVVQLSNIDKRALDEIETKITSFMMKEKKKYAPRNIQ